jgi:hypothetical protein
MADAARSFLASVEKHLAHLSPGPGDTLPATGRIIIGSSGRGPGAAMNFPAAGRLMSWRAAALRLDCRRQVLCWNRSSPGGAGGKTAGASAKECR